MACFWFNAHAIRSWWKVKIKGESQEEDSPSGLVPAAYVEQVRLIIPLRYTQPV
jgi:hypothetical protein